MTLSHSYALDQQSQETFSKIKSNKLPYVGSKPGVPDSTTRPPLPSCARQSLTDELTVGILGPRPHPPEGMASYGGAHMILSMLHLQPIP